MMKHVLTDISVWALTIIGFVAKIMPLVQLLSFTLAMTVSCITIYKFIDEMVKKRKKGDTQ